MRPLVCFLNIFSHFVGCLFSFLIISFDDKSFKLWEVQFMYFCCLCFGCHIQESIVITQGPDDLPFMFSSLRVLCCLACVLIHLKLLFVYGMRWGPNIILFLHVDIQLYVSVGEPIVSPLIRLGISPICLTLFPPLQHSRHSLQSF